MRVDTDVIATVLHNEHMDNVSLYTPGPYLPTGEGANWPLPLVSWTIPLVNATVEQRRMQDLYKRGSRFARRKISLETTPTFCQKGRPRSHREIPKYVSTVARVRR